MQSRIVPYKYYRCWLFTVCLFVILQMHIHAQDASKKKVDSSSSLININETKLIKGLNKILDTNQKKIKSLFYNKANNIQAKVDSAVNNTLKKGEFREIEKPLPYELLLNKKYTLALVGTSS